MNVTIVTKSLDVALLCGMALIPTSGSGAGHLLVATHLLRAAVANGSRPLMRSILMDNGA